MLANLISLVIYLFEKPNDSAPTYQKSSYYCIVHAFPTRQREQPLSKISVTDSQFRFSHMPSHMHQKKSKLSIIQHNYHFFLKHYLILVFHNWYKFYPLPSSRGIINCSLDSALSHPQCLGCPSHGAKFKKGLSE